MSINVLQKEIEMCQIMDGITRDDRNKRLHVFNTAMKKYNRDQMYNSLVEKYITLGKKLQEITNNAFALDSNIIITESRIRNYFFNSPIAQYMKCKNIKSCTFQELKAHNDMLAEINETYNSETIKVAIEFYETLETLAKVESKKIEDIAYGLIFTVGFDVMSEDEKKLIITDSNQARIQSVEKDILTFEQNHIKALERLETQRAKLGEQAYQYAHEMINEVFEYYKTGNKEINIEQQLERKI